jgi:hypothetical protein
MAAADDKFGWVDDNWPGAGAGVSVGGGKTLDKGVWVAADCSIGVHHWLVSQAISCLSTAAPAARVIA